MMKSSYFKYIRFIKSDHKAVLRDRTFCSLAQVPMVLSLTGKYYVLKGNLFL
ncbi:hypothetical protein [Cyanobacterium aponinum]|uniref:Uncharacterized protein n=1 Tax=Cyanobacterium aponinum 0216 TaxID=2676140 RepID=A0A844GZ55_9CHRO|nr:hypothetical protein [Cyanobacterium aponinum]MTF40342.1 hypothetical protein [Cyanobacterium aponinum 0216]